jgi:glyoxylase-like metal-dependent hydrolase (beta-lactamase superfamily II)
MVRFVRIEGTTVRTNVPGVYAVPGYSRSYIIDGDEGVTLIDTGLPNQHMMVVETLTTIGRRLSDVNAITITHAHADHYGGAAALKRATDATLFASRIDAPAMQGDEPTTPPPVADRLRFLKPIVSLMPGADPVEVDRLLAEGDTARLPEDLQVIDTPGHTPGHISFLLDRSGGVLFVGDAAVATKAGKVKRGIFNARTPAIDHSLRHIAEFQFEVALFAHSRPLTDSAAGAFQAFAAKLR